jgi:hypothetical protein
LHDLERGAATDEKNVPIQWKPPVEKRAANHFIDGVVTTDVFMDNFGFARQIENSGSMNPPGPRELALEFSQERRQRQQNFSVDPDIFARRDRREILPDRRDAFLAANAATARDRSESLGRAEFCFHAFGQLNHNNIFAIPDAIESREIVDCGTIAHDSFGNEKASRELLIVPRSSHRGGERSISNANLERLFNGQLVTMIFEGAVFVAPNDLTRTDSVVFHCLEGDGNMAPVEICRLYISKGHNFFGHHGREPDNYPMIEVRSVECVAGHGIRGDRFFDYQNDYKGQITFFSLEVFDELCGALEMQDYSPGSVRRNVMTRGIDLNELIGQEFEVQGVRFCGTGECRPCYWMDRAIASSAENFLKGRGGLRARILTDGTLHSTAAVPETVE